MLKLDLNLAPLVSGLSRYEQRFVPAVVALLARYAPEIEQAAKDGAPWEDQSGAAREALTAGVEEAASTLITLYLQHGENVSYGWWLETKFGARDAIIRPTLERYGDEIMAAVAALVHA